MKSTTLRLAVFWLCVTALTSHKTVAQTSTDYQLVPLPADAIHRSPANAPRLRNANGTSLNWSGYAVQSSLTSPLSGVVQKVTGTWGVPTVTQSSSSKTYSANWVGIDGYSSSTVEQLGTEQDWTPNGPVYYAWYEMYPKIGFLISGFPVSPGDTITASVEYIGNGIFTLSMSNVTQNAFFSINQRSAQAQRSSAEWIVEAPSSGGTLPLADFGTCKFTGCTTTLNGHTGSINDSQWQYDQIDMQTKADVIKADTSRLSRGGQAFSVTWEHE